MAGIDTSHGKLAFPPRFLPYLEKHRIFELFHELAELLVQERPKDHVKFLKSALPCAAERRDKPRIVFLSPTSFDRIKFAQEIGDRLGVPDISRSYVEMKAREARLLRKLGEQKAFHTSEEERESVCVCPGEDLWEYRSSNVWPSVFGDEIDSGKFIPENSEKSSTGSGARAFEVEEDPCKGGRVCPCKVTFLENGSSDSGGTQIKNSDETDNPPEIKLVTDSGKEKNNMKSSEGTEVEDYKDSSVLSLCICESSEGTNADYGILGKCEYSRAGWILIDFPEDAREAEFLSGMGVIPTHALRIITGKDEDGREYKYKWKEWSTVYKSIPVTDIRVDGRSMSQLADSVSKLLEIMPHRHPPMLPRIALIGSRGSGASTQAKLLSKKYGLSHVDFDEEISRVLLRDNKYSEMYKIQMATRPDPELEAHILEVKILKPEDHTIHLANALTPDISCLSNLKILLTRKNQRRGWVLTGFPRNIDQFRMLDLMVTPPNRIIFIETPPKECFIRLYYRKMDWANAEQYNLPVIEPSGFELRDPADLNPQVKARLMPHPRNDKSQIIRDIEQYFDDKDDMMKYCGKAAGYVNGNKSVESVFEQIDQIIINPSPAVPPRNPLAAIHGIEEAYEHLKSIRMENGMTTNNLLLNPPDPIFKF